MVGVGMRRLVTVSDGRTIVRQPPHAREVRRTPPRSSSAPRRCRASDRSATTRCGACRSRPARSTVPCISAPLTGCTQARSLAHCRQSGRKRRRRRRARRAQGAAFSWRAALDPSAVAWQARSWSNSCRRWSKGRCTMELPPRPAQIIEDLPCFAALFLALLFAAAPADCQKRAVDELLAADRAFAAPSAQARPGRRRPRHVRRRHRRAGAGQGHRRSARRPSPRLQGQPRLRERPRHLGAGPRRHLRRRQPGLHFRLPERGPRRSRPAQPQISRLLGQPPGRLAGRRLPPATARAGAVSTAMLAPSLPGFAAPAKTRRRVDRRQSRQPRRRRTRLLRPRADRRPQRGVPRIWPRRRDEHVCRRRLRDRPRRDHRPFRRNEVPSPVRWATERSFVASSATSASRSARSAPTPRAEAGGPDDFPFFTVWRRDRPGAPWRYIAE